MEKHKKILKRALLVIVLVFVAFFGFREIMSFVSGSVDTDSSDIAFRSASQHVFQTRRSNVLRETLEHQIYSRYI